MFSGQRKLFAVSLRMWILLIFTHHQITAVEQIIQSGFTYSGSLSNPCDGHPDGKARDLSECRNFVVCENGTASFHTCPENEVFDAKSEQCVSNNQADKVCFKCYPNDYQLFSVPNACSQYIQCFDGHAQLYKCSIGLVFDGRKEIQQCNEKPNNDDCYSTDENDVELEPCPPLGTDGKPQFDWNPTNHAM